MSTTNILNSLTEIDNQSINKYQSKPCPHCQGSGKVLNPELNIFKVIFSDESNNTLIEDTSIRCKYCQGTGMMILLPILK
jgi:Ribonuclease G/E